MEIKAKFKSQQDIIERANFKSRKVWVITEDNPEYPQTIEVELQKDNVGKLEGVTPGTELTMQINIRGREWTKPETGVVSVFNSLVCWKVEIGALAPAPVEETKVPDTSDLPF